MFSQGPFANLAAKMMTTSNILPPTKSFPLSISSESTLGFDWNQILTDFPKNSFPIISPPNFQDFLMAQLNDLKQQMILQQMLKSLTDIQQQKIPISPPIFSKNQNSPEIVQNSRKRPNSNSSTKKDETENPQPKRSKQLRKLLAEDTETNSPVSGMYIKELSEVSADDIAKAAELDETASYVHVSEESKRKVAEIPNVIGDSVCSLCKVKFDDIFKLAMHKCPRIVHEEYKCPECEKVFSCPANLASHRRWHGPRPQKSASTRTNLSSPNGNNSSTRESSPSSVKSFTVPAIQLFTESFLNMKTPESSESLILV